MRRSLPRSTSYRFRFQQLIQRYTTIQSYWRRVGRQIEEGTYRPHVMKAREKQEARREELRSELRAKSGSRASALSTDSGASVGRAANTKNVSDSKLIDDASMKRIFDDYVNAKRSNNENVSSVNYEKLQKSVTQMIPELQKKYNTKDVDFKVVVKDGRVGLKPVIKK
ncbi:MAG: MXAN_5187 C-terminal domain-containing protein [Polyangiales bacterium]